MSVPIIIGMNDMFAPTFIPLFSIW